MRTKTPRKIRPLSIHEKVVARLVAILGFGEVITGPGARGTYTLGPWTPAVGPRDRFAVYGYGTSVPDREGMTAWEAAEAYVARVGAPARPAARARARARASPARGRRCSSTIWLVGGARG